MTDAIRKALIPEKGEGRLVITIRGKMTDVKWANFKAQLDQLMQNFPEIAVEAYEARIAKK
jgi:hypothetical protein